MAPKGAPKGQPKHMAKHRRKTFTALQDDEFENSSEEGETCSAQVPFSKAPAEGQTCSPQANEGKTCSPHSNAPRPLFEGDLTIELNPLPTYHTLGQAHDPAPTVVKPKGAEPAPRVPGLTCSTKGQVTEATVADQIPSGLTCSPKDKKQETLADDEFPANGSVNDRRRLKHFCFRFS